MDYYFLNKNLFITLEMCIRVIYTTKYYGKSFQMKIVQNNAMRLDHVDYVKSLYVLYEF